MRICLITAAVGLITASIWSTPLRAQSINWVTFPDWSAGDTLGSGSSAELTVDATFTLHSGTFNGRPLYRDESAVIEDPAWPYSNKVVPALSALGSPGQDILYTLRFDYTNEGGLPAGGTVVIIDLEDAASRVTLTGYVGSTPVAVNWQASFLEVSGADAVFPTWNPATATLSGSTFVDGDRRNLVFFVADLALDAVEFEVSGPPDGIDFNTAAESIDVSNPIRWVSFSGWSAGDTVGSGSSAELTVDATFTLQLGAFDGRPLYREESAIIDDESWPYSNNVVPALSALGAPGQDVIYILRFDYTNAGGLPAGGTVVIIDLEDVDSQATITGFANSVPVAVEWQVSFLEVSGTDATFPSWDPSTATLSGNTLVDGSKRNLVFFVADRALDAVEFEVSGPPDGIDFNTAEGTVTITAVPPRMPVVRSFSVEPPVPNPFNPRVQVYFTLDVPSSMTAEVYDVTGRRVRSLLNREHYPAGRHFLPWNGTDQQGNGVASGIYFIRLQNELAVQTVRAVCVK